MAALSAKYPTLLDLAKATDPNGGIATVVEQMQATNEILEDMVWQEGNMQTGHRSTIRTGLPSPTWRRLYGGVQPTKSTTAQVTDNCGMLEDYAEVDKALVDMAGNPAAYRAQEDRPHIEGIAQTLATTIFYGDEDLNPERFTGLAPRFSSMSAANGDNIIEGAGTGSDNASIWLICWSDTSVHGIVPKGSKTGLQHRDLGEVTLESAPDGSGGRMQAYRTHYRFDCGLCVRDWRYVVRIANIDRSLLTADISTGANLHALMHDAITELPSMNGRCAWYADKSIISMIRKQASDGVKNSTLQTENLGGTWQTSVHGIPLRRCDALRVDEARVT